MQASIPRARCRLDPHRDMSVLSSRSFESLRFYSIAVGRLASFRGTSVCCRCSGLDVQSKKCCWPSCNDDQLVVAL